jgi:hypothetical protein
MNPSLSDLKQEIPFQAQRAHTWHIDCERMLLFLAISEAPVVFDPKPPLIGVPSLKGIFYCSHRPYRVGKTESNLELIRS